MPGLIKYLVFLLITVIAATAFSQEPPAGKIIRATVVEGDTIPVVELPAVDFLAPRAFKNRFEQYRYNRLVHNVKRVYPYARLAGAKFEEYSQMLSKIEKESHRRQAMKQAEYELRVQFEDELKRLTFTQGLILLKLVDRETSHTSYDLVKEFRGNVSAVFWQSFGRLFGFNLRTQYDPTGEDQMIEEIIRLIEAGVI